MAIPSKIAIFFSVFATTAIPAIASAMSSCGGSAGETLYSARFEWKGAGHAPKQMRLVLSKNRHPGFTESRVIARIMSQDRCEAVCQVENLELSDNRAASVDMSCHSAGFGTLAAPATVFFHQTSRSSVLRFGTWLQGYEQASLKVETDRSAQLSKMLAPPIQLAKSR